MKSKNCAYTKIKVNSYSFSWIIEDFRYIIDGPDYVILSPVFPDTKDNRQKWQLELAVKTYSKYYVSLFLVPVQGKIEMQGTFQSSILNAYNEKVNIKTHKIKMGRNAAFGNCQFIKTSLLSKKSADFLPGGKLTLHCEVSTLSDPITRYAKRDTIHVPECRLSEELGEFFESQSLGDVTLRSNDGHELTAHKAILSARSSVFFNMFQSGMKESVSGKVDITDLDIEVLKEVLRYIYTGKIPDLSKRAQDIFVAADKFALDRLQAMCEDCMCKKLSVENAANFLMLANAHNTKLLKTGALDFICKHAGEVRKTDGWRKMKEINPLVTEVLETMTLTSEPPQKKRRI